MLLLGLVLWWLLRSPWGRAFAALRDNPIRAESLGINITAYTLLAFAIGAACAGIGGVYFAALVQFIEPAPFHVASSLTMLLAIIVGGSGRFFGPVLGTVVVVLLPEWLRFMQNWYLAVFGFAVVALDDLASRAGFCRYPSVCADSAQMTSAERFLEVKEMRKAYGAIKAVDGVTMSVGPGEIVGVIGPNGSGKTTLFNSILGQIRPTSGSGRVPRRERHRHVAARAVAARSRSHVPDAAGVRQAVGARQPDRRRAGVQGLAARPPVRTARCWARRATPTR